MKRNTVTSSKRPKWFIKPNKRFLKNGAVPDRYIRPDPSLKYNIPNYLSGSRDFSGSHLPRTTTVSGNRSTLNSSIMRS